MIAFDSKSVIPVAFQGNIQWNHTPVGTPRGVLVLIAQNVATSGSNNDEVASVTYGGINVPDVSSSPFSHVHSFDGAVLHAFYLGSGIPSGVQQVKINAQQPVYSFKRAVVIVYTAESDTSVEAVGTLSDANLDDPSITLSTSVETTLAGVLLSGHPTGIGVTPGSGFTQLEPNEYDFGSQVVSFIRSSANAAAGSPVVNWDTLGADVVTAFVVALREV